jgi:hypothetical protein
MYWMERPEESYEQRFDAYIDYLATIRRYGLVEVSITVPCKTCESLHGDAMWGLETGALKSFEEAVRSAQDNYDDDEYYEEDYVEGGEDSWANQDRWVPVLERHGFRMVSEFPNINSGNLIQVWHLTMDGQYHKNRSK